ncbi:GTPase [Dulcicalothrix desertica PCC 7102]|uniref:GTPase n=1 Tax=Dulcicalothrix desertica PCC 7102 TaxID=232991 RepID=A0A433UK46_9CYAN|nr:dynamin family protein [Dulcicalothrix desertica]RUS94192.1 GTPase [Dulcicalothrix desertica PCC 7102]TWH53347.1 dynamin family protein [Dulcicalothrix desertica PCC 7102]
MLPFLFGALGLAVGAVVGAFTTHAAGESDRQAAQHHKTVANELTDKYTNLEKRYNELADKSKKQILDLTRQRALDEVEKDCLRLAVRLQQSLISLMWDIDREPTEAALKNFVQAVELTNTVLCKINEELIYVPSDYYARNLTAAVKRKYLKQVDYLNESSITEKRTSEDDFEKTLDKNVMEYSYKNMHSEKFQSSHSKLYDTGNRFLNYLKQLRTQRLKEGDDTQRLQSVEDDIIRALKALNEQKFQVAVIAAMKAGKSTFLNALIGADVLASETEACTVCRTDIRPIKAGQTPRLLEYQDGKREPVVLIQGEAGEIRRKFLERTHEIRETQNADATIRFELEHAVEAISQIPSLAGFTLVDTPGPNEWESVKFSTVALKQTALEALRTSDAILFILDYTSFKDNTNAELLQDLIGQRKEFLARSNKIYFILNKVDRKAEKDRPIEDVIKDLSQTLLGFGIPEPIILPASAWQGLLAKLIQNKVATREHEADFDKFFLFSYMEKDEHGRRYIPELIDIAPKALQDSGITTIENTVIQTVVRNSGWNLLSDVLATLNKSAQAIEETFITEMKGWEIEFEELQQTIEEYKQNSDLARGKVANVKKSVEEQKQVLINTFSQGINKFAENAKKRIGMEIDKVAKDKSQKPVHNKEGKNLLAYLWEFAFFVAASSSDSYKIRVNNKKDAEKIGKTINEYCTPVIQSFWLDTQDKLIREGTNIRESLVKEIQKEIQAISNELSKYLGDALEIEIGINEIQFPKFEFSGIDAKIEHQQQVYARTKKEKRTKSRCCESDKVYEVDVPYTETVSYYEIDLRLTYQGIQQKIDLQVQNNIELLERVIEKQISEDFQKGEKQINNYINRFQAEFDYLLKERATREVEAPNIIDHLESQRIELSEYLNELKLIKGELDNWRPIIML